MPPKKTKKKAAPKQTAAPKKKVAIKDLPWNEEHPARLLLYDALVLGDITKDMKPKEVYNKYKNMKEFGGMACDDEFRRRLLSLRNIVGRDKDRAVDDRKALKIALANHPVPEFNHRGEPQWNGSKAQAMLKEEIDAGNYPLKTPEQIWKSKAEFQKFGLSTLRWKIHQYIRTQKYLQTLKDNAEAKLKPSPDE